MIVIISMQIMTLAGILIYFLMDYRSSRKAYLERITILKMLLLTNSQEVSKRNQGFNKYEFLKYNLHEALIIQPEISLKFRDLLV